MKHGHTLIISLGMMLASCGSVETLTYDELRPSRYSLPPEVKTVAVVNNAVPTSLHKPGIVTVGYLYGDGVLTSQSLADVLADSRYFEQVIICDSAFRDSQDTPFRLFTQEEVTSIADDLGVDMVLSLDEVIVNTKQLWHTSPHPSLDYETLRSIVTPVIHAYLPDRQKPVFTVTLADSLEWDIDPGLSDKVIVEEMAFAAAIAAGRALVPYWSPATRQYFDGENVTVRDAGVNVRKGNWERARELWQKAYSSTGSKKKQARLAYNLALASEMLDDIEGAERWVNEAYEKAAEGSDLHYAAKLYKRQVEERKQQISLLKAQMKRFDGE